MPFRWNWRVTLMIAKEITVAETQARIAKGELSLPLDFDRALPLDNLVPRYLP